jgi:hypothetical protein
VPIAAKSRCRATTSRCAVSPRDAACAQQRQRARGAHRLALLRAPGALTVAWCAGARKRYVAPLQLFMIANVIFFALQWLTDTNISSTLDSYLHHQDWSELAGSLLVRRLEATHATLDSYAPVFDRAVVLNAKSLIVLMTLGFALLAARLSALGGATRRASTRCSA